MIKPGLVKTVLVNVSNPHHAEQFLNASKKMNVHLISPKDQLELFDMISVGTIDAYIISKDLSHSQRAINSIRSVSKFTPIVSIGESSEFEDLIDNVDLNFPLWTSSTPLRMSHACSIIMFCLHQCRLYSKVEESCPSRDPLICFGDGYSYDTSYRVLRKNNEYVAELSSRHGKILQMLAARYKQIVKRDLILEVIWKKTDQYSSRSLDVYLSGLRSIFREKKLTLRVSNIAGSGILLQ